MVYQKLLCYNYKQDYEKNGKHLKLIGRTLVITAGFINIY
jgi:hypothetical protein